MYGFGTISGFGVTTGIDQESTECKDARGDPMDRRTFLTASMAAVATPAAVGLLSGCGSSGSGAKTVRLGDTVAESNPEIAAERFFGDRVKALTKSKYEVKVFPNSTLGDTNRMNEQVRQGTLQLTKTLMSNLTAFDRRIGVMSLPYAFTTQKDLFDALDGQLGAKLVSVLEAQQLKVLAFFDSGSRNVYNSKRPIQHPSDLHGLRLRVPQDPVAIDTFNTLGAQATPLAANEVYSALQQGVIDGAENNPIFYVTNKHVEEAKYFSWTRHQFGTDTLLVSSKWFGKQPADVQDALVQAGKETQARERDLWSKETDKYVSEAGADGAKINDDVDIAAFKEAVKPVLAKNRASFGDLINLLPVS
jgi:tripartite ATP-independent transporter DctP family solute receptor